MPLKTNESNRFAFNQLFNCIMPLYIAYIWGTSVGTRSKFCARDPAPFNNMFQLSLAYDHDRTCWPWVPLPWTAKRRNEPTQTVRLEWPQVGSANCSCDWGPTLASNEAIPIKHYLCHRISQCQCTLVLGSFSSFYRSLLVVDLVVIYFDLDHWVQQNYVGRRC